MESGEDRIMVTSMAINVLCYAWSENQKLVDSTPEEVRAVVRDAAKWLVKYTLSGEYKLYNTFFSGSVKGMSVSVNTGVMLSILEYPNSGSRSQVNC